MMKDAKRTGELRVAARPALGEERINIHPNEGFDLGMMTTNYAVEYASGGRGTVWLLNECPRETIEMSPGLWEKLGKPARATLAWDGCVLSIER